jgi:hypothetical protein
VSQNHTGQIAKFSKFIWVNWSPKSIYTKDTREEEKKNKKNKRNWPGQLARVRQAAPERAAARDVAHAAQPENEANTHQNDSGKISKIRSNPCLLYHENTPICISTSPQYLSLETLIYGPPGCQSSSSKIRRRRCHWSSGAQGHRLFSHPQVLSFPLISSTRSTSSSWPVFPSRRVSEQAREAAEVSP